MKINVTTSSFRVYPIPRRCPYRCAGFLTRYSKSFHRHLKLEHGGADDDFNTAETKPSNRIVKMRSVKIQTRSPAKIRVGKKRRKPILYSTPRICPICAHTYSTRNAGNMHTHLKNAHNLRMSKVFNRNGTVLLSNTEILEFRKNPPAKTKREGKNHRCRTYVKPRTCPICETYTSKINATMATHIRRKHGLLVSQVFNFNGSVCLSKAEIRELKKKFAEKLKVKEFALKQYRAKITCPLCPPLNAPSYKLCASMRRHMWLKHHCKVSSVLYRDGTLKDVNKTFVNDHRMQQEKSKLVIESERQTDARSSKRSLRFGNTENALSSTASKQSSLTLTAESSEPVAEIKGEELAASSQPMRLRSGNFVVTPKRSPSPSAEDVKKDDDRIADDEEEEENASSAEMDIKNEEEEYASPPQVVIKKEKREVESVFSAEQRHPPAIGFCPKCRTPFRPMLDAVRFCFVCAFDIAGYLEMIGNSARH